MNNLIISKADDYQFTKSGKQVIFPPEYSKDRKVFAFECPECGCKYSTYQTEKKGENLSEKIILLKKM